ncbi:MAG TPA: hypothetical protein PLO16_13235 [Acidocella sp.]|nr:hypothetical protein [Acidocella sp.]
MNDIKNMRGLKLYPAEYSLQLWQAQTIADAVRQISNWLSRQFSKASSRNQVGFAWRLH